MLFVIYLSSFQCFKTSASGLLLWKCKVLQCSTACLENLKQKATTVWKDLNPAASRHPVNCSLVNNFSIFVPGRHFFYWICLLSTRQELRTAEPLLFYSLVSEDKKGGHEVRDHVVPKRKESVFEISNDEIEKKLNKSFFTTQ